MVELNVIWLGNKGVTRVWMQRMGRCDIENPSTQEKKPKKKKEKKKKKKKKKKEKVQEPTVRIVSYSSERTILLTALASLLLNYDHERPRRS
jgi:hypothetical protein